jgi:predicted acyltransferase (DUF342 family)
LRFGPVVFSDDVELTEPVSSFGPITANGNLVSTSSIKANGPLIVSENLEIGLTLKVNGPLTVKGSMICQHDASAKINGPAIVRKGIIGGLIRINGPLHTQFVEALNLSINGPVNVEEDIIAEEEIVFGIGYSRKNPFDVGGVIEAPIVHLKNHSSKYSVSGIIRKVIGIDSKFERIRVLEGLTIRTKLLRLEGVELENCEIDAEEIEYLHEPNQRE